MPEILRIPIHEVSLQTKLLVPNNEISIHEFLSATMDPPSIASVSPNTDEHNRYADHWPTVKAALTAGAYPKLIRFDEQSAQYCNRKERIRFHCSSQLGAEPPNPRGLQQTFSQQMPTHWCIYEELLQMGRHSYAKCCTAVSPITIALICGRSEISIGQQTAPTHDLLSIGAQLQIEDWIGFETNTQTLKSLTF